MPHTNKILVPVDFSDQSLIALDQSYNLARHYRAEITLLYVIESRDNIISKLFGKEDDVAFKKEIEKKLESLSAEVEKKSGIKANFIVAKGSPYDKIVEVSDQINAIFIIMGTNGASGWKEKFIGSNALRVVKETSCPVITIHGKEHRSGCKHIVLPLDLSKETREKVRKAVELAKMGEGAIIHVVSVMFTKDELVVNKLTIQMEQVKKFIEKAGVECTTEIIKGIRGEESLAELIIDYAKKKKADLIMIMTQQETDVTLRFIGSAAQEIIYNSDIPVLSIVPSPKKDMTEFPKPY